MNQDTGGAIKGPGRADLFWGSGPYAEAAAGHMRHEGELYILMKNLITRHKGAKAHRHKERKGQGH